MHWTTYASAWFIAGTAFAVTYTAIRRSETRIFTNDRTGMIDATAVGVLAYIAVLALYEMQS